MQYELRFVRNARSSSTAGPYSAMRNATPDSGIAEFGRNIIVFLCILLVAVTFPFSLFFCLKIVKEYERAVIFRLGRVHQNGATGPGIVFIYPCIDKYQRVDLRLLTYNVPPQEILSKGTKTLTEILSDRVNIAHQMQTTLDEATEHWGVKVERVEVKNVRLPELLQRAMAAEAEATRNAKAEVIAAEGEQKASGALREAARVISSSKFALQLRYLQTLSSISAEKNSTILFPVPIRLCSIMRPGSQAGSGKTGFKTGNHPTILEEQEEATATTALLHADRNANTQEDEE